MHSNVEILSAVVAKWLQPLIADVAASKLAGIPFISNIEARIKASGWVRQSWHITSELQPFIPSVANALIQPAIVRATTDLADEQIPTFAFGIVDAAIANGSLSILDGNIKFSAEDLQQLRHLLENNLPLPAKPYQVKED